MPKVHLIGIGGAGLSAIATVLLQQGYQVSGSDMQESPATARLVQLGATVFIGQQAQNLADPPDVVVISSAIAPDNPELVEARRRGLKVVKRAEWLGHMLAGKTGIAVAGTHGKTTTTAMIAWALQQAGQQPGYIVGGFVPQLATGAAAGLGKVFVIEADEYDHTFLGLRPQVAVITIVEWDHPDIFPTPQHLRQAFVDFVRLVPANGLVIACGDAPGVAEVTRHSAASVITYGLKGHNRWQAANPMPNAKGGYNFDLLQPQAGRPAVPVSLAVPGLHNVSNALAALIVAHRQGVELGRAAEILGQFTGVGRRFELKGEANGITIIDDYAHHPTEIRATLAAAKTRFGARPVWAVFQPHTFSRTLALLDDFVDAFGQADHVIVVDIYASREKDEGLINSRQLVAQMSHPDARYIGPLKQAAEYVSTHITPPAVVITLGAGDGNQVGEWVLERLQGIA